MERKCENLSESKSDQMDEIEALKHDNEILRDQNKKFENTVNSLESTLQILDVDKKKIMAVLKIGAVSIFN